MFKKIEPVAWTILIISFLTCLGLTLGTPLTIRWYVRNCTRPLDIQIQPRSQTVTRQQAGSTIKAVITQNTDVRVDERIELSAKASTFLLFYKQTPGNPPADAVTLPLITVELNGETQLRVENAHTPRFASSPLPHQVTLEIERGANVRITVEGNARATRCAIRTPHGNIQMEEGSYVTLVEAERTEFNVTTGRAHVLDPVTGDDLTLSAMQHTELTADGLGAIRVGARNIMHNHNGDFEAPLEDYWQVEAIQSETEQPGSVRQFRGGDANKWCFLNVTV